MQIGNGENHVVIAPPQIAVVQPEALELPQLPILSEIGIARFAQERLKIHDAHRAVVERQTNLEA